MPKQAGRTGQGTTEGIKILYQRKPVADAKTVGEVVGAGAGEGEGGKAVEFGVIVMGGGTAATAAGTGEKGTVVGKGDDGDTPMGGTEPVAGEVPVAQGISGEEVLQSAEFWDDLKGWLMQRVRDEAVAERCWSLFKRGWDER